MQSSIWRRAAEWIDAGIPFAVVTVIKTTGSAPRKSGAKMLVTEAGEAWGTVGGGALEHAVIEAAKAQIPRGAPLLLSYRLDADLGMSCGGGAEVFVEPQQPARPLILFGAGHINQALCPIALSIGYAVTVVDDRAALADADRFPGAVAFVHSFDPGQWGDLPLDERASCVVATSSHAVDHEVVQALLAYPLGYLGVIGSRRKRAALEQKLRGEGLPAERISAIRSPVGLSIGAQTPAEISVSIAAELIAARYGVGAVDGREPPGP
jgi:xanthine dehydrogenase accessory factor